jgi:hypothetical protein
MQSEAAIPAYYEASQDEEFCTLPATVGREKAFCADVALAALAHYVHNLSVAKDGGPGAIEPSMR